MPTIIAARHWDRLARAVGIDPDGLHDDIVAMIERLPDALADTVAATDLEAGEAHLAGTLTDVVARWTSTCRAAMRRTDGDRG